VAFGKRIANHDIKQTHLKCYTYKAGGQGAYTGIVLSRLLPFIHELIIPVGG